ncbi:MAG: BrnA antitoxin family protein, partial [Proteobacteria bacterium]|nr:BrnA antitoxin family protein [Pseudomonadota bacterium]
GIAAARRKRGRPVGSGTKEQVAIRIDHDILEAFRADGPGWQTRMNDALREWVEKHPTP